MASQHLDQEFAYRGYRIKYSFRGPPKPSVNANKDTKVLVFVHGTPWASDVFLPIANTLLSTNKYRIVLYDLLGYGQSQARLDNSSGSNSQKSVADTSTRTQAELLTALLAELKIDGKDRHEKAAVIAHDIAGVITLRAHLLHGCQYASLCLLDTNVVLPWGDVFYNMVRDHPHIFNEIPAGIFESIVRAVVRSASASSVMPQRWEETLARHWAPLAGSASEEQRKACQRNFVKQISDSKDADSQELLDKQLYGQTACDVKILWGEKDSWIPREKMERLAAMLGPRAKEFVTIPDAGHLIMVDQPERVTFEIANWVASTP